MGLRKGVSCLISMHALFYQPWKTNLKMEKWKTNLKNHLRNNSLETYLTNYFVNIMRKTNISSRMFVICMNLKSWRTCRAVRQKLCNFLKIIWTHLQKVFSFQIPWDPNYWPLSMTYYETLLQLLFQLQNEPLLNK